MQDLASREVRQLARRSARQLEPEDVRLAVLVDAQQERVARRVPPDVIERGAGGEDRARGAATRGQQADRARRPDARVGDDGDLGAVR